MAGSAMLVWRRLLAEAFGAWSLVMVGAGGAVIGATTHSSNRLAVAIAPGLLVMAMIYTWVPCQALT